MFVETPPVKWNNPSSVCVDGVYVNSSNMASSVEVISDRKTWTLAIHSQPREWRLVLALC